MESIHDRGFHRSHSGDLCEQIEQSEKGEITNTRRRHQEVEEILYSAHSLSQSAEESDLKQSISLYKKALESCTLDSALHSVALDGCIGTLTSHHGVSGDLDSLDEALCWYEVALRQRPVGHPLRRQTLTGYAALHTTIVKLTHSDDSRDRVIAHHRKLISVLSNEDRRHDSCVNYLALALYAQYHSGGGLDVLEEAICLLESVLKARDSAHPFRETTLNGLAIVHATHYGERQNADTLDKVIHLHMEALDLRPPDHPLRDVTLFNLCVIFGQKFEQDGHREDLELAKSYALAALELRPPGHIFRFLTLSAVGNQCQRLFDLFANKNHLAQALSFHREALDLNPPGAFERDQTLNNLALSLKTHFDAYGDIDKLEESIMFHREALTLRPIGHPYRSTTLFNLGTTLTAAYEANGVKSHLLEAVQLLRECLELRPNGHLNRRTALYHLGLTLWKYYDCYGSVADLLEAIGYLRESLSLNHGTLFYDDPRHALAVALFALYRSSSEEAHLAEVLSLHEEGFKLRKKGHQKRAETCCELAAVLFRVEGFDRWTDAFSHLVEGVGDPFCSPRVRLRLAQSTMQAVESKLQSNLERVSWSSQILDIYSQIIQLLPQVAHLGLDPTSRLRELVGSEHLCRIAATRSLLLGELPIAVEILEEGRNTCWTQALHLRAPDVFADLPGEERTRFEELTQALNVPMPITARSDRADVDKLIEQRRRFDDEIQNMITDVRSRPGFERFLKTESFQKLTHAASRGPVVVLLSSDLGSHALIILNDRGETSMVNLAHVTSKRLSNLRLQCAGTGLRDEKNSSSDYEEFEQVSRLGVKKKASGAGMPVTPITVLEEIWTTIVLPVFECLNLKKMHGRDRPRLHWCPVGDFTFLPLHAAGKYAGQGRVCVSDFVVSSYTPSLSMLIKARKEYVPVPKSALKTVILAETNAVGPYRPLPNVVAEAEIVGRQMESASVECLTDLAPCVDATVATLPSAHILHLACHGIQKEQALQSHFALHDGPLTISTLSELDLPRAILAFLSACETVKGDENQPDQAMHLAASLLFCGFRSVIGTMWAMHDEDGPVVAKAVYAELLGKEALELDDIPYALDAAVQVLRACGASPIRWATFVHMGA